MANGNVDLDQLIPPEIVRDDFHELIEQLARESGVRTMLEIGSSAGRGSTSALVAGLQLNPSTPKLFCIELSKARFEALRSAYAGVPQAQVYNVSSVGASSFPSEQEVSSFYHNVNTALRHWPLEQVLSWLRGELEYLAGSQLPANGIEQVKGDHGIERFDLALIDGSEFTGRAELDLLYGAGLILLDDIRTFKNHANFHQLLGDPEYALLAVNPGLRNGYAAFRRKDFRLEQYESIRRAVERIEGHMVPGQEKFLFEKVRSLAEDATIIEIGSYKGRSTAAMAHACIGTCRHIYCIDTWDGNDADFAERNFYEQWQQNVETNRLGPFITTLRGRSHEMLSRWGEVAGGKQVDFVFIDGSHQYEDVLKDLELSLRLTREGGWIALHDVVHTWPGPLKVWRRFGRKLLSDIRYCTTLACGQKNETSEKTFAQLQHEPIDPLPVHFFTIVLNGEPFIRHHIEQFKKLPFDWHWHIIEGVADLKNDTAWSVRQGGRVPHEFHKNGLSIDGTSEYLDEIAAAHPSRVTIYRKPGQLWQGKREMVAEPLADNALDECLLWEIDTDELWTAEQLTCGRQLFLDQPDRTAAFYWCRFFVGPDRVITTRGGYANNPQQDWLRTWRYRPGMAWAAHEPPVLAEQFAPNQWRDVGRVNPFLHAETEAAGLVFQHYAYATLEQVRFKQAYYGYQNAIGSWLELQYAQDLPRPLKQFLPWVRDETMVDRVAGNVPEPLLAQVPLHPPRPMDAPPPRPTIVIDGVFFQLALTGIARVWWSIWSEWIRKGYGDHLVLVDRGGTLPPLAGVRRVGAPVLDYGRVERDREILQEICDGEGTDLFMSTYYTLPLRTPSVQMVYDMIPELRPQDFRTGDPMWLQKRDALSYASAFIAISQNTKRDLVALHPQIKPPQVTVAYPGVWPNFKPASAQQISNLKQGFGLTRPYLLAVGSRSYYKNVGLLFDLLMERPGLGYQVLCVGEDRYVDPRHASLDQGVIKYIGRVDDATLAVAYSGAVALVYPSKYEGFGLPIVEAFGCECPVITAACGSIPEVAADAVIYIDPDDRSALASAIAEVQTPAVRQRLAAAGRERLKLFRWEAMAEAVWDVLVQQVSPAATGPGER